MVDSPRFADLRRPRGLWVVLAVLAVLADDLVYLRGGQEEIWQKMLQLPFAPNPMQVLEWMLGQGGETPCSPTAGGRSRAFRRRGSGFGPWPSGRPACGRRLAATPVTKT